MGKRKTVPVKAVVLAVILFLIGSLMLILGSLLLTGYLPTDYKYVVQMWIESIIGPRYSLWVGMMLHRDRGIPLIVLGSITFLPGFYYVRLAYYAWRGYRGYDYSLIPTFD
jgi:hypothetical protein